MLMKVRKRMGFRWAGLYFLDELPLLPGRLPLLGKKFRAVGGPGYKKVNPCHLYSEPLGHAAK